MEIPKEVQSIVKTLTAKGHEAYIVGGCVRDLLLGRKPQDWDITTNAKPEQIQKLFPKSFYENRFFTVGVMTPLDKDSLRGQADSDDSTLKVIEVTTFRSEAKYTDKRHPDQVRPAKTLQEDLRRRDFTINAMALGLNASRGIRQRGAYRYAASEMRQGTQDTYRTTIRAAQPNNAKRAPGNVIIIDPFGGQKDLQDKLIRAVGEPEERFSEDALRMIRAVRLATTLNFQIEPKTGRAIKEHAGLLRMIAKERIADELRKIIMCRNADYGIELLREYGLLQYILPELEQGWGVRQNKHHKYTVWEHNLRSLRYAAEKGYSFEVRMASLLHDVGKPRSKRGEGPNCTFYGHEVVGARMTAKMLERLRFPRNEIEKITLLVRAHMFNYDPEVVTDASVRRLVAKVGVENMRELVQVREADRIGSGVPKAVPYRLRHFMFRVEKVLQKPVSRKVMKINGDELMELLNIKPGPRVGAILDLLFEEVLDEPARNKQEYLVRRAKELGKLSDAELLQLRKKAKEKYEGLLKSEEEQLKRKYYVK